MSNVRYVHGWEEQLSYTLYATEIKALNAFNLGDDVDRKQSGWDETKAKVILRKGWECIDCLKLHDINMDARQCCYREYSEEKDKANYDMIGEYNKKKAERGNKIK